MQLIMTCQHVDPLINVFHDARMRVGYGYERAERDFGEASVDRVWIDTRSTDRMERAAMLEMGLRPGDTVVLLALGDLGRGTDLRAVRRRLEEMRVTVEVQSSTKEPKPRGRPRAFTPDAMQDRQIKKLWYADGMYTMQYVLRRTEEIMGQSVSRNQLDHRYGPRNGSMPKGRKR